MRATKIPEIKCDRRQLLSSAATGVVVAGVTSLLPTHLAVASEQKTYVRSRSTSWMTSSSTSAGTWRRPAGPIAKQSQMTGKVCS